MFRLLYRLGLLLGAATLSLFMGAKLIHFFDPYRIVTEDLIQQVAAEPQRTVRLNEYGTLAAQTRTALYTGQIAAVADKFNKPMMSRFMDLLSIRPDARIAIAGLETAVEEIAALDATLSSATGAETLSRDLARLHFYDLEHGDGTLADLYAQSTVVSQSLGDLDERLESTAASISAIVTILELEKLSHSLAKAGSSEEALLSQSLHSWIGLPDNMRQVQEKMDEDVGWLVNFEQEYELAKRFNERWNFDTLRVLPRFVAANYQALLLGVIGSLLVALVGWAGSIKQYAYPQQQSQTTVTHVTQPAALCPCLTILWPDGRHERQPLPQTGHLIIGNIIIRRARVRYYLELTDDAFPIQLNGRSIRGARILKDGDRLQVGLLQTIFQLAA